jgi:hypothetical protein
VKRYLLSAVLVGTAVSGLFAPGVRTVAATIVSFVASDDPGKAPDANSNSVDAWTVSQTAPGGSGSGFFQPFALPANPWVLFSYPDGNGASGSIQADHTFDGGALTAPQTVQIDWANRSVNTGAPVGVSLTSAGTPVVTVKFVGGDPLGVYRYDDFGGTNQSTGEGFAYQNLRTLKFSITGASTYTASFGSSTWSGTYSGAIDGIRVFNNGGGNGSDVPFNNLTVSAPEPSTLLMAALAGLCCVSLRRWMA